MLLKAIVSPETRGRRVAGRSRRPVIEPALELPKCPGTAQPRILLVGLLDGICGFAAGRRPRLHLAPWSARALNLPEARVEPKARYDLITAVEAPRALAGARVETVRSAIAA